MSRRALVLSLACLLACAPSCMNTTVRTTRDDLAPARCAPQPPVQSSAGSSGAAASGAPDPTDASGAGGGAPAAALGIVDGSTLPDADPRSAAVVSLDEVTDPNQPDALDSFCTGALITQDLIVTAAHCFFDDSTGQALPPPSAIVSGADAVSGTRLRIASYKVHPSYRILSSPNYDIAWIKLAAPAPAPMRPVPVLASPEVELEHGDSISLVGYGYTDVNMGGGGKRLYVNTVYSCSTPIDSPFRSLLGTGQLEFKGGTCQGDSGGPSYAHVLVGGHYIWTLIGVLHGYNSAVNGPQASSTPGQSRPVCSSVETYTSVFPYLSWLSETSGEAIVPVHYSSK